jgi:fucose permease
VSAEDARARLLGYLSFALIGWTGLLVPSLIRSIEGDFGQTDAGLGLFYFLYAAGWASGGAVGGILTERRGRRLTLPLAASLLGCGLAALAVAGLAAGSAWPVFLVAAIPVGLGGGAIDGGGNALILDLRPGKSGALNLLHVFFSVGALTAPLAVGALVAGGAPWPSVVIVTGVVALAVAAGFGLVGLPSGRRVAPEPSPSTALVEPARFLTAPIVALGLAIGCYVASEIGVSSWLVRFLVAAPVTTATAALSLFWAGLTVGRLVAARAADRIDPVVYAIACAVTTGLAIIAAVLVPSEALAIALFAVAGFGQGPIYPLIMSIGGGLQPHRTSAVAGFLTAAAVIGGIVYPPLIGFLSVTVGIGAGIAGAGVLGLATAVALGWVRSVRSDASAAPLHSPG